jgi:hypothetical protein
MFDWCAGATYSRLMDYTRSVARLQTHPLLVAVEFEAHGRWWPGRVSTWIEQPSGWHASVTAERGTSKAGVRAGWLPVEALRPGEHQINTTCLVGDWASWEPPAWPPALARFAVATSNIRERDRWEAFRQEHPE